MFRSRLATVVFSFSLAIALLTLPSCAPELIEKDGKLGKESAPNDVQKVLDDALDGISIGTAQVHQFVEYEDNYRVELGPVIRTRLYKQELISIVQEKDSIQFDFYQDFWKFNESGAIIDEKHAQLRPLILKLSGALDVSALALDDATPESCDGELITDPDGTTYDCVRYFNVVSARRRVAPPEAVRTRANCGNVPDCLMNIRHFSYDQVKWREGKTVSKLTVTAEIAEDVPDINYNYDEIEGWSHTPPVLSLCFKGQVKSDGHTYSVTQCTVLKDFQ